MNLLKIFKKKVERENIKFEDIPSWLDKFVETKGIGTTLGILKRELNSKIIKIKDLLNKLETTPLKYPFVYPERTLDVINRNRNSFIRKVMAFLSEIHIPEGYEDVEQFLEDLSYKIDSLVEGTQKNYFILKEFMEDEVNAVKNKIFELDKIVAKGREQIQNTVINQVKEIKVKIAEYYRMEQEIYAIRKKVDAIESTKLDLYDKRSKIEEKLNKIKAGLAYKEYQKLLERKASLNEEIKNLERSLSLMFSDLEYVFKKYHNKFKDKLIEFYLKDPVKASFEDKTNKIFDVLRKIEKNINDLEIKPQKLKSFKNAIKKVSPDKLKLMKKKILEFREEHEFLQKRIKNNSVRLNVKEREAYIINIDNAIETEEKKIEEIENELERRNLKLLKQKISELVEKLDNGVEIQK